MIITEKALTESSANKTHTRTHTVYTHTHTVAGASPGEWGEMANGDFKQTPVGEPGAGIKHVLMY